MQRGRKRATIVATAVLAGAAFWPAGSGVAAPEVPTPGGLIMVAGTGDYGDVGDGGKALEAQLGSDLDIDVTADGTVYIGTSDHGRVVKAGVIDRGPVGDALATAIGPDGAVVFATETKIYRARPGREPQVVRPDKDLGVIRDIDVDGNGRIYVVDGYDARVLRLDPNDKVTTLASWDPTDDSVPGPEYVAVTASGTVYVTRTGAATVSKIDDGGKVSVMAGTTAGYAGDGGPARAAQLSDRIGGIDVDASGRLYIADNDNGLVRVVENGIITSRPHGVPSVEDVTIAPDESVYVAGGSVVSKLYEPESGEVSAMSMGDDPYAGTPSGTIKTVATGRLHAGLIVDTAGRVRWLGSATAGPRVRDILTRLDAFERAPQESPVMAGPFGSVLMTDAFGVVQVHRDGTVAFRTGASHVNEQPSEGAQAAAIANLKPVYGPADQLHVLGGRALWRVDDEGALHEVHEFDQDVTTQPGRSVVDRNGSLYVATDDFRVVKYSGGNVTTVAGTGQLFSTDDEEKEPNARATRMSIASRAVAVTDDGTLYAANTRGVVRIDRDGLLNTVIPGKVVDKLAVDSFGNLYFSELGDLQVKVLIRPGDLEFEEPFPWNAVWIGLGALAAASVVLALVVRQRRKAARAGHGATS